MKKRINDLKVLKNIKVNSNNFILELEAPQPLGEILPGQFAEVLVAKSENTFLRRPFSIHDIDYDNNTISLLIQIVGNGTNALSLLQEGASLNLVYPLGNSFRIPDSAKALLIGGGTGIAPIYFLSKVLFKKNIETTVIIGGRTSEALLRIQDFKQYAKVFLTTDDGSAGEKGLVTEHSIFRNNISEFDMIYSCGPEPMMRSVARHAISRNINCEVSLENLMACGFGACLCCIVETTKGNVCTCTAGPVFNVNDLKWLT